jgi:hypothetical protein
MVVQSTDFIRAVIEQERTQLNLVLLNALNQDRDLTGPHWRASDTPNYNAGHRTDLRYA